MADTDPRYPNDAGLATRLRGLPLHTPAPDAWNEISLSLSRTNAVKPRRRWLGFAAVALAASLLIAASLPWSSRDTSMPATNESPALSAQREADLDWLRARSSQLEQWLGDLPSAPAGNGRDLMATIEVEDLIALVDLQLGASHNARDALPLWQQHVALLETLSVLRSAPYEFANASATPVDKPSNLIRL